MITFPASLIALSAITTIHCKLFTIDFHLRRSEVLEHGEMSPLAQHALQLRGHSNAAAHHHDIDVVGGAFQENVPDVAAYDIAFLPETVGRLADLMEDLPV